MGKIKIGMFCKLGTHVGNSVCLGTTAVSSLCNRHGHPLRVLLRHAGAAAFFLLFGYMCVCVCIAKNLY